MFWNIPSCPRMFQSIQGINNRELFDDVDFTYSNTCRYQHEKVCKESPTDFRYLMKPFHFWSFLETANGMRIFPRNESIEERKNDCPSHFLAAVQNALFMCFVPLCPIPWKVLIQCRVKKGNMGIPFSPIACLGSGYGSLCQIPTQNNRVLARIRCGLSLSIRRYDNDYAHLPILLKIFGYIA